MARQPHSAESHDPRHTAPGGAKAGSPPGVLLMALLLAACSGGGGFVDGKVGSAEADFEARHARLLHAVLDRPGELRSQLESRDRRIRERNLDHWEAVIARQDAYFAQRAGRKQRDETQFLRMLELQRKFSEKAVEDNSDRWAQFIERRAPADAAGGETAP